MHHRSTRRAAGMARTLMALAVLAAGVVIAPPAQAKVPSRSAESTLKCKNGKKAKIWWQGTKHVEIIDGDEVISWEVTQFAVDNKCKDWLYFDVRTDAQSESDCCHGVQVAPGANFTKTAKDVPSADRLFGGYGDPAGARETKKECVAREGLNQVQWDVAKNGKVTTTEDCPRKYPESEYKTIVCPESWDPGLGRYTEWAFGLWKVDSNKILKLAVSSNCQTETILWWRTKDGKRVALWVDEQADFDLWKDELDPLPQKTKDGKVTYIPAPPPTAGALAAYDENWRLSPDGQPYRWHKTT